MVKIREAIVVEGRYDKNTLAQIVDAPIFETRGFGIMKDREMLAFLRGVAEKRGLIILTDSDGAGFVIRNYLKGALPKTAVKQAYIPDVAGKESRKAKGGKEGKLGVEGMRPEILIEALRRAGATFEGETGSMCREPITKQDLYALHLTGWPESSDRRAQLKRALGLPEHLSTNGLLEALNVMFERDEFLAEDEET
ncbi:MAG: DUF4093 domain-containing protein [Oscillospiraceae bacterium]|nr:DUF4093 domain-containing protein [Oscillospiraceae bacterium]